MTTITLLLDGRSQAARVGVGAGFIRADDHTPIQGDWSSKELDQNRVAGAIGVPCRGWTEDGYQYFMRVKG